MKKVAFVTLSMTKGGAERVIANMCNDYLSKKYEVTIISFMRVPAEYVLNDGIKLIFLDKEEKQKEQGMLTRFMRRKKALKRELKKLSPDFIISFLPEPNFISLSLRNKLDIPTIISVRNDPVKEYAGTLRQLLMKHYYKRADGYVFQTEEARDYFSFSKYIMSHSEVISNPLDKSFIAQNIKNGKNKESANAKKIAMNVGRLEKQKDQVTLIEAFAQCHEKCPDWELRIYGEGSLHDYLMLLIKEKGLLESVFLCGNVDDIRGKMEEADLFILSSLYEGMPNALMEAMAMELPVISTDCPCGGPSMLTEGGKRGMLVPVSDVSALADKMLWVMEHPNEAEELGKCAGKIKEELSPEMIYGKWDDIIKSLLEQN